MTENEAIEHCEERAMICDKCGEEHGLLAGWLKELLQLREETQQYRAIGTVERFEQLSRFVGDNTESKLVPDIVNKMLKEYPEYLSIGTVEECRAAVERTKPKKAKINSSFTDTYYQCPICNKAVGIKVPYCRICGHAIDWRDDHE